MALLGSHASFSLAPVLPFTTSYLPSPSVSAAPGRKPAELPLCSSHSPSTVIPLLKPEFCVLPTGCSLPSSREETQRHCLLVCSPFPSFSFFHTLPYPFFIYLSSHQRNISFMRSLSNFLGFFFHLETADCVCSGSSITT